MALTSASPHLKDRDPEFLAYYVSEGMKKMIMGLKGKEHFKKPALNGGCYVF